ncbi:phosphoglycerate mutase-like protein [Punctularia strigosozonata HHB-11173 SS5]|uniref:phosphoglycerate mutase-like protein n=1 Tax=Punctularia strigosozonata (strain HHB-11173) TaxID=741275 RepID=UPI0004418259|nr:phosphoglycerate mutase-like protein [Punctularia strigosozonata HHB-11173 SS5]EIN12790.1 phosphoglycerate mutase-like protein [Punctularia strigosozonata HHB-11173 SS5]
MSAPEKDILPYYPPPPAGYRRGLEGFQSKKGSACWKTLSLAAVAIFVLLCYRQPFALRDPLRLPGHRCGSSTNFTATDPAETYPGLPTLNITKSISRKWASFTPWHPVANYTPPPEGCTITQVNLLQRHGARRPSSDDGDLYAKSVKKLVRASKHSAHVDSSLKWLKHYHYDLGEADLIGLGAEQSFYAGQLDYERYAKLGLISSQNVPFVRASGKQRVVDSATNWTAGVAHESELDEIPLKVIIPEEKGINNTLNDDMCPSSTKGGRETHLWLDTWGPAVRDRINELAFGKSVKKTKKKHLLDLDDVYNVMSTCVFGTVVHNASSPFCDLFEEDEWAKFEYYGDLEKFYGRGYGQDLGPVQGVGYVNELLARLTNTPVVDNTQTNKTLDSDPATFPLGKTFYADFSHENLMAAVYAALGLFKEEQGWPLDPERMDPNRIWRASRITPFSTRLVVEKLACEDVDSEPDLVTSQSEVAKSTLVAEYVRILVNDAVHPLEHCSEAGNGGERGDGLCTLKAFVESQAYARSQGGGDWERCGWKVE